PLISVLLPVYNANLRWLRRAIQSVQGQLYRRWELCIVDDASTNRRVWQLLQTYARRDSRIKVMRREQNGHISAASNDALNMAEGDFVRFWITTMSWPGPRFISSPWPSTKIEDCNCSTVMKISSMHAVAVPIHILNPIGTPSFSSRKTLSRISAFTEPTWSVELAVFESALKARRTTI